MKKAIVGIIGGICIVGAAVGMLIAAGKAGTKKPDVLLTEYMAHIEKKEYAEMYAMLDTESAENISEEDFTTRNSNIYEGIGAQNIQIEVQEYKSGWKPSVVFQTNLDTIAGELSFQNEVSFTKEKDGY